MADDLESLAARVERGQPSRDLWLTAFNAVRGEGPTLDHGRFFTLLEAEAWRDAAAMLMPEGWTLWLDALDRGASISATLIRLEGVVVKGKGVADGHHAEARARLAAALRAHAASKEPGR